MVIRWKDLTEGLEKLLLHYICHQEKTAPCTPKIWLDWTQAYTAPATLQDHFPEPTLYCKALSKGNHSQPLPSTSQQWTCAHIIYKPWQSSLAPCLDRVLINDLETPATYMKHFSHFIRELSPHGRLYFIVFGTYTFCELQAACKDTGLSLEWPTMFHRQALNTLSGQILDIQEEWITLEGLSLMDLLGLLREARVFLPANEAAVPQLKRLVKDFTETPKITIQALYGYYQKTPLEE